MAISDEERRERQRERNRAYYQANRERLKERQRAWRERNPGYEQQPERLARRATAARARRRANAPAPRQPLSDEERRRRKAAYQRKWRLANLDKVREEERLRAARRAPEKAAYARRYRAADANYYKIRNWRKAVEQRRRMLLAGFLTQQDGRCYLCEDPLGPEKAVLDHDHRCCRRWYGCEDCPRGAACWWCNIALGHLRDDPDRLERMAANLRLAMTAVDSRLIGKPQQGVLDLA